MFIRTSLFASALLLLAAPAMAQAVSGGPPTVAATAPRSAALAPASTATPPAGAVAAKPPLPSERQGSAPRPAVEGKVAGQPATQTTPPRTN